ncbi:MAG TPA: ATP-binding protein [Phycisphaerae bacterium]|nr:ATP-binding protein [Phycisphaerae bacterium]
MAKSKQFTPKRDGPSAYREGLGLLSDLAEGLVSLTDAESLQEEVLEHVVRMFPCGSAAVFLWDEKVGRMRIGQSMGRAVDLDPEMIMAAEPVQAVVLDQRRPLVMPDPALTLDSPALADWHGLAIVPLAGHDRVRGLLVLGDLPKGQMFTESDTAMMSAVGGMAAVAMETALALSTFRQEMGRRMTEAMAELTRATAELQRIRTFNEELFHSAPVGIIVFDREFRVTFRNSAAERLWPDDRSIPRGARRTDIAQRDPDWEGALRDVVNMQRTWRAEEVTFGRPGREDVRVNLSCSPLFSQKETVVGGVLIVEDVTQRVQMEKRLEVSERLAGVGRLAAVVAHEINNPLDGIIRLVNLARRPESDRGDEPVEKYLAEAHKGLVRMTMIVRDLLDFSRSASGAVGPMPIRDILTEAAQNLASAAEQAGVTVEVACDAEVPALKSGTLYQVVLNLVKNAIEATPKGGRIEARARCENEALVVEVADSGPGIPPEALGRLFEPFYTLKAGGKGTGLGLVISKDLIEKQGGAITAANRIGARGAVFTVRIPMAPGAGGR